MPISHPFPLFIRPDSRVLVLGSFPSVRSREEGFYYGHPQNRFWPVMAALFCEDIPPDTVARTGFLERRRIALWDVVASCEINRSSDRSIILEEANPIDSSIAAYDIRAILLNGGKAARLYETKAEPKPRIPAVALPSTSAANAAWRLPGLIRAWAIMLDWLAQ